MYGGTGGLLTGGGALATTGFAVGGWVLAAVGSLVVGLALLRLGWRRHAVGRHHQ